MWSTSRCRLLRRALPARMSLREGIVLWQSTDAIPAGSATGTAAASSSAAEDIMTDTSAERKEHFAWRLVKGALYVASTAAIGGCAYASYGMSSTCFLDRPFCLPEWILNL